MYFLGIDIGTGGTRGVAIDGRGRIAATADAAHAPFASPQIGWAEQDPDDWWRAAKEVIARILIEIPADRISAIGFSGQMHGSVLLDGSGSVLRPALLWCDQRTAAECDEITAVIGRERLIDLVSNPAITGFTLPKLLWVRKHEPAIWNRVRSFLLPKDYIRFKLSGDLASDVADSSGTLMFDVRNRKWSDEILNAFAIDPSILPKVYESIEITGEVSAAAAAETGLRVGTPLVAGAGDNAAGAVGMGIVRTGSASATIGTSGVIFAVSDAARLDSLGRIHTLCHAVPGRWHNTGVTLAAGLSFKWFRDNLGGGADFDSLVAEAQAVPSGSDGAVWLPYLMGERAPHLDPDARAAFVGITASHTRGHLVRAVLEGVAFSLRDSLEIFRSIGAGFDRIRLGGGGARSPLWRRIQADVYGVPVEIVEGDEGAALGAAVLAGVGAGNWESVDAACAETIRVVETIDPDPESAARLERNYKVYKLLYGALRPAMAIVRA